MKVFIAACLLVAVSATVLEETGVKFQAFKLKHGKTYKNQVEETARFNIFKDNLRAIEQHNVLYEQGLVSYKKGINRFTDMTQEEFRAFLTLSSSKKPHFNTTEHVLTGLAVPDSIDWRTKGQVTGVKDQGNCGSCWAFSVTGSTEAAYYRKAGKLVSLSEQQLVDCSTDINAGCNGGYLDETFTYVKSKGLEAESTYPYKGTDGSCKYSASKVVTKVSGHKSLKSEDENALLDAVGNVGPVSVAIDATYLSSYESGIYEDDWCSPSELNHGVLVVGYGTSNGKKYWIVKNSWGGSFGESGYFRLLRGKNECGVAEDTVYPII
uniref:Cathepsin L 1 n=1 Tax=Diaprepes abbreviatus TaxID=13040 RepID=Q0PZI4_DIAAB|nr:cathepsin L 1 precursor [Diaprepes abbreviatus]